MFDAVTDWHNLWRAFNEAARGKRGHQSASAFDLAVADRLIDIQHAMRSRQWRPGAYRHFFIREPKLRRISAAPFADRVVHHALCQVIEPLFEPHFSPASYANRVGKGTHRALHHLQAAARRHRYVVRLDVVQHFPSIDHGVLRARLATRIGDSDVLSLIDAILASGEGIGGEDAPAAYFSGDDLFAVLRPRGLPIGNLTSQFWSNVMLDPIDWFAHRTLRCADYLRYVDDIALFDNDKQRLWEAKAALVERLAALRLRFHETQAQVLPCCCGIPWLGFVVYPTHRRLKGRNTVKFTRRLQHNIDDYCAGRISFGELDASVQGWINHVRFADTWGLREHVFSTHPIRGGGEVAG